MFIDSEIERSSFKAQEELEAAHYGKVEIFLKICNPMKNDLVNMHLHKISVSENISHRGIFL